MTGAAVERIAQAAARQMTVNAMTAAQVTAPDAKPDARCASTCAFASRGGDHARRPRTVP
jgi:hypothetical protein